MDGSRQNRTAPLQPPPDTPSPRPRNPAPAPGQPQQQPQQQALGRITPRQLTPEQLAQVQAQQRRQALAQQQQQQRRRQAPPQQPARRYGPAGRVNGQQQQRASVPQQQPQPRQGIGAPIQQPRTRDEVKEILRRVHLYAQSQGWNTLELMLEVEPQLALTDAQAAQALSALAQSTVQAGREQVARAAEVLGSVVTHLIGIESFLGLGRGRIADLEPFIRDALLQLNARSEAGAGADALQEALTELNAPDAPLTDDELAAEHGPGGVDGDELLGGDGFILEPPEPGEEEEEEEGDDA